MNYITCHKSYAMGITFRRMRPRHYPEKTQSNKAIIRLKGAQLDWPRLIEIMLTELKRRGYRTSTRKTYEQVVKNFSQFTFLPPGRVTAKSIKTYLNILTEQRVSWSWLSANITVLRTVFDKLGGMDITRSLATPKRPYRLPEILDENDVHKLLKAPETLRDQLLLGLIYGCGLKVSEACRLRWSDINFEEHTIRVIYAGMTKHRHVRFPEALKNVLRKGVNTCLPDQFIFQGKRENTCLSTRMAEIILKQACSQIGLSETITCMTLRHSYAVHCLRQGATIREVQEALGHENIETTMIYESFLLTDNTKSPSDALFEDCTDKECKREYIQTPALDTEGYELPFGCEPASEIRAFYQLLKMKIKSRFLSMKRSSGRGG
jgi:site-specific recombinase XerD